MAATAFMMCHGHESWHPDPEFYYQVGGGPMFQADQMGLLATRTLLRALQDEGAPAPVTLWDVLIRNGRRFGDLDA